MLVARAHGYNTNAIQGYNSKVVAEKLGLDPECYVPNMIWPLLLGKLFLIIGYIKFNLLAIL